jgi:HSP20 family protein
MARTGSIIDELEQRFDELRKEFSTLAGEGIGFVRALATPPVDIVDEDTQYVVSVELPGVRKEDVKLEVEPNAVRIQASRVRETEETKKRFLRRERTEEHYQRTLALPDEVSADGARAQFRDGILPVTIHKTAPEERRAKQVDIDS